MRVTREEAADNLVRWRRAHLARTEAKDVRQTSRRPPNHAVGQQFQVFAQIFIGTMLGSANELPTIAAESLFDFANDIIRHVIEEG